MLRYRRRDCLALARLVNLARQFSGPLAGDLVRPHRRLIKSSKLRTMQAPPHLAAHDRWSGADSLLFFLFSDILVGAMVFTRTKADGTVTPLRRTRQSASGAAAPGMFEKRRASIMAPAVREGDGGELVYEAHVVAPLLGMRVEDVPNDPERQGEHLMRFVVAQDWHISVGAASAADKQEWIADITTAMAELQDTL